MLLGADSTDLGDRAALNYLLGWTEIRHRGNPMVPLEYFSARGQGGAEPGRSRTGEARAGASRLRADLAGHLIEARRSLIAVRGAEDVGLPWSTYAGGSAAAAAGYVSYWSGELDEAIREFGTVIANGGSDRSFTNVARMMIAYAAAESGDVTACRRAAIGIQEIPLEVVHGVSWPASANRRSPCSKKPVGRTDSSDGGSRAVHPVPGPFPSSTSPSPACCAAPATTPPPWRCCGLRASSRRCPT